MNLDLSTQIGDEQEVQLPQTPKVQFRAISNSSQAFRSTPPYPRPPLSREPQSTLSFRPPAPAPRLAVDNNVLQLQLTQMRVRILHRRKVVEKVVETNLEGSRVDGDEGGGEMVKEGGRR